MTPHDRWMLRILTTVALAGLYLGSAAATASASVLGHGGADGDGDIPVWPFALGAIAAVAVGALWALRRGP
ncbi:hypothetical protein [Mycobacterium spongiae]|uniref:hypothetical protein n=1 Tax=Mycobacterium spongiae TaxID=886343 RepID=UPI001BAA17F3|nr:hypothetical protein [Mycobacterium spongiae]